jgi:hypothetical protein
MKKLVSLFFVMLLFFAGFSVCLSYPQEPLLVKTADINANPINYDGKFLAVKGQVTATGTQPSLQIGWYDLADETGTIAIFTTASETPTVGDELWVSGTITNQTKIVGQRSISCFLQEKVKEKVGGGLPMLPIVLGVLGVGIIVVLLVMLLKPKSKPMYQPVGQPYAQPGRPMAPPPPPPQSPYSQAPPPPPPSYAPPPPKSSATMMEPPRTAQKSSSETFVAEDNNEPVLAYMIVKSGSRSGTNFSLKKSVIKMGRDPGNDIMVDDKKSSREHAKLKVEDGKFILYDLASSNGTYVNGVKITNQSLMDGDEVQIGDTVLVVKKV